MNLILIALCILAEYLSAGANERDGPWNIACLSNSTVMITCAASKNDFAYIDWHHQSPNMRSAQALTNNTGSNISTNYLMIRIKNQESLVINSVQPRDAGVYYCIKTNVNEGVSKEFGSHLIVLASDPTCDVENVTVKENDYIRLQCSVTYGGFWRPVMEWRQLGFLGQENINNESILVNVTESQQYATMTVYLQILAKPHHNSISFECNTYFDYSEMLREQKVNNNTPDYNHTWKSPVINVLYGPRNVSTYPASDTFYPGDKLTCSAMGNPEPEYEWTDNETVYVGSQIDIIQSMIREQPYVFSCEARNSLFASFANITFTVRSRFPPIYFAIVAIWLICTLLLIGIMYAIRKCVNDRKKRSYAVPNSREHRNEPNDHIVPHERIGVLNENGHGDYVDLLAAQPRNEARNLNGTRTAGNCADHIEHVGADGTQYVQMNIRPDNHAPTTRSVVHHSTMEVSNYASIDHTHKVPKRRN